MLFLIASALAGVTTTVELGPEGPRVVRAVRSEAPARTTTWTDARHDPRVRSLIGEHGGEAIRLDRALYRVRLPDGALPTELPRMAPPAERVHNDRPVAERLDLLILAEGYTEADAAAFAADSDALVAALLQTEPFDVYADLLNIWRAHVVSPESGASKDTRFETVSVDTALGCTYGCGGADRIICCDDAAVFENADAALPDADAIFVLVNDDDYGGAGAFTYSVSFTGEDWLPVAVHELGHVLGELYDEYDYGFDAGRHGVNCAPYPAFVPWSSWIGTDGIGAFERCTYSNLYRPTESGCLMRELEGDFCPVCREALVRAMYSHLPPLLTAPDAVNPGQVVQVEAFATTTVTWSVDGEVFATGPEATLPECGTVVVEAHDTTSWVRSDPENALRTRRTYELGECATTCASGPVMPAAWWHPFARRR